MRLNTRSEVMENHTAYQCAVNSSPVRTAEILK